MPAPSRAAWVVKEKRARYSRSKVVMPSSSSTTRIWGAGFMDGNLLPSLAGGGTARTPELGLFDRVVRTIARGFVSALVQKRQTTFTRAFENPLEGRGHQCTACTPRTERTRP